MKMVLVGLAIVIGIMVSIPFSSLYGKDKVKGNGTIVTRTIEVKEYSGIRLGNRIEGKKNVFGKSKNGPSFIYTQKEAAPVLQITTDENLFPLLEVEVKDNCLYIQSKERGTQLVPSEMRITGSSRSLTNVSVVGCINFVVDDPLNAPKLKANVSGVGDIKLNNLTCGELDCSVSGVGNIYLKGVADKVDARVSGVGHVYGFDCVAKDMECSVSGVGGAEVNVSETLNARMSGVGSIKHKGNARVDSHASGVGSIKHID